MSRQAFVRRMLPAGILLALLVLAPLAVARAATYATIYDDANLFTSTGRARIEQAAAQAHLRVTVVTTGQSFSTQTAWHHWLRGHSNDRGGVIIGIEARYHKVYVIPGPDSGLSVSNASRGVQDQMGQFNSTHFTDGVVGLIQEYHALGAQSPGTGSSTTGSSGSSGGFSLGWVIPVIIVLVLLLVVTRVLRRRRTFSLNSGYGQGPAGRYPGPYQGTPPGGYGNPGGGAGSSFVGGVAGGVVGSMIGNEIFDRDGGAGTANPPDPGYAPGYDPTTSGPSDTPNAEQLGGGWSGDAGGGDGGSWGGDAGGGDGGSWGGDSGGGGDSGNAGSW